MNDILEDLVDLHKQATTERSHYYTAKCIERAVEEIQTLRRRLKKLSEHPDVPELFKQYAAGRLG